MAELSVRSFFLLSMVLCQSWGAVDIVNMPVNTWLQVPNSHLRSVAPSASQYPDIQAVEGVSGVINDWCGAAFDTKRNRLIIHGGGHNGYYGNEVYAFDVGTQQWVLVKNPTANPTLCTGAYSDGTPASRHTYGGIVYMSQPDRMFVCGGCPACPAGGCGMPATWAFNFSNTTWQNMSPSGTGPVTCCGDVAAYDSATNKVYFMDIRAACGGYSTAGLFAYSYSNNSWTHINSDVLDNLTYTVAIDSKRHTFLAVGGGKVYGYSLDNLAAGAQTWTTSGDTGFIGQTSMGLAYDPVSDKYVGWKGGAVYVLDPVTKVWTSHNPAGGPPSDVAGVMNGIYNRWQYVPSVNAFTTVVDVDGNVYFYKLTAGPGTGVTAAKAMNSSAPHILVQSNPFQRRTSLILEGIPSQHIRACGIYNMRGELVCDLTAELKSAGGRKVSWDAGLQSAGVYLFRAYFNDRSFEKSFILIK